MASLEIQKAIVAAVVADGALGALIGDRIYDRVPDSAVPPYVNFGVTFADVYDGQEFDGTEVMVMLHTWSRDHGRVECEQIMDGLRALLHEQTLTLETKTFTLGRLADQRTMQDPDGVTTHGVQRFRFIAGT